MAGSWAANSLSNLTLSDNGGDILRQYLSEHSLSMAGSWAANSLSNLTLSDNGGDILRQHLSEHSVDGWFMGDEFTF
ncbi:hypothetical protein, partial [Aeromonas veronii]|uniref:hypothetical protein n=1 Tax=Aeromonas veronii TaxID=654 RepID=UPI003BA0DA34